MIYEKRTIDCVLRTICRKNADKTAILFGDTSVSYKQMYQYSMNLAASFKKMGIQKNDKVAIILPNCLEYLYSYFALFLIGAWAVPISTRWESEELYNVLSDSDANTVLYQDKIGILDYREIFSDLKHRLPLLKNYILLNNSNDAAPLTLEKMIYNETGTIDSFSETIDQDDIALLAYTSGTTGKPKGVMIRHKSLVSISYHLGELWGTGDDVGFSVAPLYSAQGFCAVLVDLVAGITMKWHSNFNPHDILTELSNGVINAFHTQPTMWTLLLSQSYFNHLTFDHLKKVFVSGSLCSRDLASRIENKMGCRLCNGYGLIEATSAVTATRLDDPADVRLNTVGRPLPGVEIKVVGENREELPKGEIGELAVKGHLMAGYYKNEEKTREVLDEDGWLYTGDQACFYDDMNLRIVGRLKDMVIRGGFNVYPSDIEDCLLRYNKIEDVAVVGEPDEILGEKLVAFVIPKPDADVTAGDVKRFCRSKISNYKIPDEVIMVAQFPILLSGKIQKNILKQWAVEGVPMENKMLFNARTLQDVDDDNTNRKAETSGEAYGL